MALAAGRLNKLVTLSRSPQTTNDSDGFFEALVPQTVWAAIEPQGADGRTVTHLVTIRYHAQVTMDTRLVYLDPDRITTANPTGARAIYVKGFQNVAEHNEEMRLLCEEVIP